MAKPKESAAVPAPEPEPFMICTYGPSGIGKTTDLGYSFPNALFIAAPGALTSIENTCGYVPTRIMVADIEEATMIVAEVGRSRQYDTVCIDDFSFLSDQTFSKLEANPKLIGFKMWGKMRDIGLEFRNTARMSGVNIAMNCFTRNTAFVTSEGITSFESFEDGDTCTVLTHADNWREGVVRRHGVQPINFVKFKRGTKTFSCHVTPNHRWLKADGSETTDLRAGDMLASAPTSLQTNGLPFVVSSIEPAGEDEVWCFEVEEDRSFVLDFGLPTGNCWEQPPKTKTDGSRMRGGPQLAGKLPESIPAMCDSVFRAVMEAQRKPWGAVYRCNLDPNWILKDRFSVADQIDPAPMNLAELLRAAGRHIPRLAQYPNMEKNVELLSNALVSNPTDKTLVNEIYQGLVGSGVSVTEAKWTVRDAMDRAVIRSALQLKANNFIS